MYSKYRHLAIEDSKNAPTEVEVHAIETLLGAKLPVPFLEFLKVANGGYLEYVIDVFFGIDKSEALSFCSIFSTEYGQYCDETFIGEIKSERAVSMIPKQVLPFARDGGGSIVYLDLTPEGNGRVIAYVQGLPEWTGLRTESEYIELAPSFEEYVEKLRIDINAVVEHLREDVSELSHIEATETWLDIGLPNWRNDNELSNQVDVAKNRIKDLLGKN